MVEHGKTNGCLDKIYKQLNAAESASKSVIDILNTLLNERIKELKVKFNKI